MNQTSRSSLVSAGRRGKMAGPFAWLWGAVFLLFILVVNEFRVEWTVTAQYSYGWAVPVLCGYLLLHRWKDKPSLVETGRQARRWCIFAIIAALALWLPTRLLQEASPDYRVAAWAAALILATVVLSALQLTGGMSYLRHFGFIMLFFLVSVPWLRPMEDLVVNHLTRLNVAATIEVLGWLGVPALQHGNTIEVSTGGVGIDEACSGIRSFQATLMISLFFGELYRLSLARRIGCILAGFGLSFLFNIVRTGLLTLVAAKQGTAAISSWHDPAGITILVACFLTLWLIGVQMAKTESRKQKAEIEAVKTETLKTETLKSEISACQQVSASAFAKRSPLPVADPGNWLGMACCSWIMIVEVSTESWYRAHERNRPEPLQWAVVAPESSVEETRQISPEVRSILRFSDALVCQWRKPDGSRWRLNYFNWEPGRTWVKQVTRHPPESCLSASGWQMIKKHGRTTVRVSQLALEFECYTFEAESSQVHVFYCLWEEGTSEQPKLTTKLASHDRIRTALEGRRNPGMKVVEFAVWGIPDHKDALAALSEQLQALVQFTKPQSP